jgi:hypothetical protein
MQEAIKELPGIYIVWGTVALGNDVFYGLCSIKLTWICLRNYTKLH